MVGIARSVTDFHYCCYLSDLAVDERFQTQGIGKMLSRLTNEQLKVKYSFILSAAPLEQEYYPKIGFELHHGTWILRDIQQLK